MKISVAICTWNGSRFLKDQLDSIKDQTRPADEVLLFDDGSSDGTPEIAAQYIRENGLANWRLSANPKNLGYIRNFRQAIEAASGDWIVLCDQDDVWTRDKLEKMETCIHSHSDAKCIAADFSIIDANGEPGDPNLRQTIRRGARLPSIKGGARLPSFEKDPGFLLGKNFAPGCTIAFSKEVRAAYLRETACDIPHDWEILLIAQMLGGLYYLPEALTKYRIHGNNAIGVKAQTTGAPSLSGRMQTMDSLDRVWKVADRCAKALLGCGADGAYREFLATRRRALETGGFANYLRMARMCKIYRRVFSPRERLGDLILILTRSSRKETKE